MIVAKTKTMTAYHATLINVPGRETAVKEACTF